MHSPRDFDEFFSQRPVKDNISSFKRLRKFINDYPDQELAPNLLRLEEEYKYYRAINGDGNCFYRAIMFLYLREADLNHFEKLFSHANIFACDNLPFSNPKKFDSDTLLQYAWQKFLFPLAELQPFEREKQLERLINSSKNLDAILVCYFRALNFNYLLQHKAEFQPFSYGGIQQDLQRIITFGRQSEGLELFSLAKILQSQITVLMVHKQAYQKYVYNQDKKLSRNYIVSYRPGHYDIPSTDQSYVNFQKQQKSSFYQYFFKDESDNSHRLTEQTPGNSYSYSPRPPSDLKVISIRKPSQLRYTRTTFPTESPKKAPSNMNEFRKTLEQKTESSRYKSSKIIKTSQQIQQKQKVTGQPVKIKSAWMEAQQKRKKQKIVSQSIYCIVPIVVVVIGLLVY